MTAHIHHKEMRLYAEDAAETDTPWERWENMGRGGRFWYSLNCHPCWDTDIQYRRKPKVVKVRLYKTTYGVIGAVAEQQVPGCANVFDWCSDWFEVEVKA